MKIQFKTLKMCVVSGVFALVVVAQPALAQTRRSGAATQSSPSATPQPGASSGSELGNYRNEKADQWIPLEEGKRQAINTDLQATVVELLELFHDRAGGPAKQSHGNLRGLLYLPLHEQWQEYADTYCKYADLLADRQVLEIMTERMYTVAKRVRARIESTGKNGDEVTSNKFQDLSYVLDKQIWQFRVHMQ